MSARVCGIGVTNQRDTTLTWDRHNGKPIYNVLVWQYRHTEAAAP